MAYSSSYSSTTSSTTSSQVQVSEIQNGDTSLSSTSLTLYMEDSSPDDSDGLAAVVGGDAVAVGEDTLASGTVYGELVDSGAVTTADLSASMTAAAESPDGAFASATTFAGVSDGAELVVTYTLESQSAQTSDSGPTTATASSTTELHAHDLQLPESSETISSGEADDSIDSASPESQFVTYDGLDGNVAVMEFEGLAMGEDSFVFAEAFVLAVEDELSLSSAYIELAVE